MILQHEISTKAKEWGVPDTTVDKDFVLGHFLNCFFNFENTREFFVFKGGTCLKKCYFPDYRFSEDLDFTLVDSNFPINEEFIQEIMQACTKHSGIQFHLTKFEKNQFHNEDKGYKSVITFWGANHSKNRPPAPKERWTTKIELDISFDEVIHFPIQQLPINHPYSDSNLISEQPIPTYSLEEILTEKVRAFYQRSYKAPRDFYDVWYLLQNYNFIHWDELSKILKKKCALKNKEIKPIMFEDREVYRTVARSWSQSIAHHLAQSGLPDFEIVWEYLRLNLFTQYFKL